MYRKIRAIQHQQLLKKIVMIRLIFLLLLPSLSFSQTFFENVNQFLIKNVHDGKIDYQLLKEAPTELDNLILGISEFYLNRQDQDFKTAFYINAYNLLVIKQVTDNYPIQSPMDIEGFFKVNEFSVAGEMITLDEIEFRKLIEPTQDPRIHFALGCAAKSCPFLYDQAYTPQHIQQQLHFRAQLIIDRPNYVQVNQGTREVVLNKIFDWYQDQFVFTEESILGYINKYRFYSVPEEYEVKFQEYDWSLNSSR